MRGASGRRAPSHFYRLLLVGLALLLSSPSSTLAQRAVEGQAPKADEKKNAPSKVVLKLVRKTDGQPISGATVVVSSYLYSIGVGIGFASPQDASEQVTDQEGRCLIEIPREFFGLAMWLTKDGFAPCSGDIRWQGDKVLFYITDGRWERQEVRQGSVPAITLNLEPGQPIGGLVKDDRGQPIRGAEVTVAFDYFTQSPDEDLLAPSKNWGAGGDFAYVRVSTDAEGRWRCTSLQPDPIHNSALLLRVVHPGYVSDTGSFKRQVSVRTARAMTGVLPMKSGASVSGVVRDTKGNPVSGARVVLAYSNHPTDFIGTRTDATGRFLFPHVDDHPPLWRWIIEVEAAGFAPASKVLSPGSKRPPVEVSLTPGRPFYGRVVDRRGEPVAGIVVRATLDYLDPLSWRAVSDSEGRFVWRDAPQEGKIGFGLKDAVRLEAFVEVPAKTPRANLTFDPD
jgi:uncharacterized GH25 family protein